MSEEQATVFVIDDDPSVRHALQGLFETVALKVELFGSVEEFLSSKRTDTPGCLVLDIRLPGPSGLDLQRELRTANIQTPIIFITGHGDVPMSVKAMKAGAIEFLIKPFRDQDLLDAVRIGIEEDRTRRREQTTTDNIQKKFLSLTPREREIMALLVAGRQNKQIAGEYGLSDVTVRIHRQQVMRKMGSRSIAELVMAAERLKARGNAAHQKES
jgi:FixJ family two-component response regulator